MKSLSILFFVAIIAASVNGFAQTALVTGGGDVSSPAGSVAFTIGETMYIDYSSPSGNINEGVQQPHYLLTTSSASYDVAAWDAHVFPNPVSEILRLHVAPYQGEELHYELISLQGQLVLRGRIASAQTDIPLHEVAAGNYLFRLNSDQSQTFKVIVSH